MDIVFFLLIKGMVCFLLVFCFSFNIQEGKLSRVVILINHFLRCAEIKASSIPGDGGEEGNALHFPVFLCSLLAAVHVRTVKLLKSRLHRRQKTTHLLCLFFWNAHFFCQGSLNKSNAVKSLVSETGFTE